MNTLRKALLGVIRTCLFIVPFIPLYVSRVLFFPYITGKAFIFRTLVEIAFAAWIVLVLFWKEYRPRTSPLLYAFCAFVVVITLASIFGVNPLRSFWSNFERMEGLLMHLHLFAYFLVAAHVFRKQDWFIFFNLFVVAGLGQNIVASLQKMGYLASPQSGARTDGTIGNATYVAAYSTFVFAITLLLFLRTKVRWARAWYGFMAFFTLLAIYFTATRGAALAFFVGALVSGILYVILWKGKAPRDQRYKKIVIGALIFLVVAAGLLRAFKESSFVRGSDVLSRFASISLSEGKSRFLIWNMGLQGFKERPILGWGLENYNVIFAKYYDPRLYAQEPWFDRSHNIVFDWLINAGILGFAAYVGIFVAALFLFWKRCRSLEEKDEEKTIMAQNSDSNIRVILRVCCPEFVCVRPIHDVHEFRFIPGVHSGVCHRTEKKDLRGNPRAFVGIRTVGGDGRRASCACVRGTFGKLPALYGEQEFVAGIPGAEYKQFAQGIRQIPKGAYLRYVRDYGSP